jgi:hypothetical protein
VAEPARSFEIHYADEWAALYVDGKLVRVGNSDNTEEEALHMLGVVVIQDDAFMRGQDQRKGVAPTLGDVENYRQLRDKRRARAAELREQADQLRREADTLEASVGIQG